MRRIFILLVAMLLTLGLAPKSHASLSVVGTGSIVGAGTAQYQLIYDSAQNITWLDYTESANSYSTQSNWASTLKVDFNGQNISGWTLPSTVDGTVVVGYNGTTTAGYNITSSQMGYLYYADLSNKGQLATNGSSNGTYGLTNVSPFNNLASNIYWSGTAASKDSGSAWVFSSINGAQDVNVETAAFDAIAVHTGDVATLTTTPIPAAAYLLGSGLLGLVGIRKKMQN